MFAHIPVSSSMSLGDLKRLIKTGEGTFLEFKKTISSPEKIAREVCAFANTKGGILLIGVNDDKTAPGVTSFYEEEYLLAEAMNYFCEPPLDYSVEIVPVGHREVVVVKVEESDHKPVVVKHKTGKTAYIRDKDKSIRASKERTALMKNENRQNGITFQYGPNEQKLFRYLNEYDKISVNEYSNLTQTNKKRSAQILINLVSIGVLNLFSHDKTDYFTLSNKAY